jgi:hypothetical protein
MACVAFDLDNTLGFFEVVNALAPMWSVEYISAPDQHVYNAPVNISYPLQHLLDRAKKIFADYLLDDANILSTVLRPDLDAMILPLLEAKKSRKVRTVIIYSNTGVTYSVQLAKYLIETIYKCPGFFSLTADHWHPLRENDMVNQRPHSQTYVEPYKTIETLQLLFKKALHTKKAIPLQNILFVDDRPEKHRLEEQEKDGLTYLMPKHFRPKITTRHKEYILFLAFKALSDTGLLRNREYLESPFCKRNFIYDVVKKHPIQNFQELLSHVCTLMSRARSGEVYWTPNTGPIISGIRTFLNQVKP